MRSLEAALARRGKLAALREWFPDGPTSGVRWYPVASFLPQLAVAGALVASPAEVHRGMYEIGFGNALGFVDSLLGRTLIRLLSRDPVRVVQQAAAAQRQSTTFSQWHVELPAPRTARMLLRSEYVWIESYQHGSAVGTYDAIGCPAEVKVTLTTPYDGTIDVSW